ncbi:MAG: nucleotide exchange factor GrpE [Ectothiorhodospiraceae bacterium AqS1]|nr:nucleotide exchange factor GrpE [Ectothiorhodospiraceae bacterium AqS1]
MKHLKNTIEKLESDFGEARDQIETAGGKGDQEKSKDTRDQAEGDGDIPWPAEAVKEFANEFLDSLDGFDLGLIHAEKQGSAQMDGIVEGINLARDKLVEAVEKLGIEIFDPKNKSFDPKVHRAIGMQPSEGEASGTILFVARKGCLLNGKIMRFADVIIAK